MATFASSYTGSGTASFTSWGQYGYTTYGGSAYSTSTAIYPTTTTISAPVVFATPPTVAPPDAISTVTGIDPAEVAAATFGKMIPLWAGGMPRLGCHIIFGPTTTVSGGVTYASYGVSFGMPAINYLAPNVQTGSRELRELRLDGFKVWSLTEGFLMTDLTFRFYGGTETQGVDPLVSAAYPAAPVAHKGQCCVFIENLALTDFAGKVPFVSAVIADITFGFDPEDGITLGQALTDIAGSRLVGLDTTFTPGEFEANGLDERVDAVIIAEKVSWLDLLNRFARLHLWDVLQTSKLLVQERGTVDPDISLDLSDIVASDNSSPIVIERAQQSDVPRELDYSYIDIDRDYEINTVTASRPRAPVPATVSAGKDTIALPSVHTVQEAVSWATLRRFKDELARETVSFTTSIVGYEIEPGDIVQIDAGFKTYIVRVLETVKGANWTNRIKGEPVLRCQLPISFEPPGEIVGLQIWYRGDDLSGSDNSMIATWMDASGNGRHAPTSTAGIGPLLATNELNDLNVVRFSGGMWFDLVDLAALGWTSGTIFCVLKADADPGAANQAGPHVIGSLAQVPHYSYSDGHIFNGDMSTLRKDCGDPAVSLTSWRIFNTQSAANDFKLRLDGAQLFSTATNTVGWSSSPIIGAGAADLGFFTWSGYIAEWMLYNTILTQPEREKIEGYLAHKWDLTANLDASHPYKLTPPPP
jgi:Putative phage tail protein